MEGVGTVQNVDFRCVPSKEHLETCIAQDTLPPSFLQWSDKASELDWCRQTGHFLYWWLVLKHCFALLAQARLPLLSAFSSMMISITLSFALWPFCPQIPNEMWTCRNIALHTNKAEWKYAHTIYGDIRKSRKWKEIETGKEINWKQKWKHNLLCCSP